MKKAETWSQLNSFLIDAVSEALKEVGDRVNQLLREHVDTDVYKAGSRTNYYARGTTQPTYGLRDSITTSDVRTGKGSAEVEVFHDSQKMELDSQNFVHGSNYWKGGNDIRDILPLIIDMGLSGDLFGSGWWQDERPYFRNAVKELKDSGMLENWFKQALKRQGIEVE